MYINIPYIITPRFYGTFISKEFFQELSIKGVYIYIYNINGEECAGFKCYNKSVKFMKHLEEKFPDLVFQHFELEEKFIFKGRDLFTYNIYNKSNTFVLFCNFISISSFMIQRSSNELYNRYSIFQKI